MPPSTIETLRAAAPASQHMAQAAAAFVLSAIVLMGTRAPFVVEEGTRRLCPCMVLGWSALGAAVSFSPAV